MSEILIDYMGKKKQKKIFSPIEIIHRKKSGGTTREAFAYLFLYFGCVQIAFSVFFIRLPLECFLFPFFHMFLNRFTRTHVANECVYYTAKCTCDGIPFGIAAIVKRLHLPMKFYVNVTHSMIMFVSNWSHWCGAKKILQILFIQRIECFRMFLSGAHKFHNFLLFFIVCFHSSSSLLFRSIFFCFCFPRLHWNKNEMEK